MPTIVEEHSYDGAGERIVRLGLSPILAERDATEAAMDDRHHGGTGCLARYLDAQNVRHGGFATALAEIRSGGKRTHWIWYVFPQLAGLGASAMSVEYAIADAAEARAYLAHPELASRLLAIAEAVADQLRRGRAIDVVLGSSIDAAKLVSSMTLFGEVARTLGAEGDERRRIAAVAEEILDAAARQGYPRCRFTLDRLRAAPGPSA